VAQLRREHNLVDGRPMTPGLAVRARLCLCLNLLASVHPEVRGRPANCWLPLPRRTPGWIDV
jgi:hypothetical protein